MMFLLYVALNFATLVILCRASAAGGLRLWASIAVFGWTISQFNTLIEAVAFGVMPLRAAVVQLLVSAIVFAILSCLAILVAGRWSDRSTAATPPSVSIRAIVLIVLGYQLLYWSAGTLVWPYVADFYNAKGLPPSLGVAALQVPRALIFVAAAWLWLRTDPKFAPVILGVSFAILGAIAPSLPDNPYMPEYVRMAHAIETGASNFLFGLLVGWLLRRCPTQLKE